MTKSEIQNPNSEIRFPIGRSIIDSSGAYETKSFGLRRFFRRPDPANLERTAARNRVERLFAVNFRSSWTR